jgi:hypothetical protein
MLWKDMHQALIEAATKTALVLPEPMPLYYKLVSISQFYQTWKRRTKNAQKNTDNFLAVTVGGAIGATTSPD